MIRIALLLFFFSLTGTACYAQKALLFTDSVSGKEVMIRAGDLVKFSYKGYIGQAETITGVVMAVRDSVVEIAMENTKNLSLREPDTRKIYLHDLTGFKRFRKSRPYLVALATIASTVGVVYLFIAIEQNATLTIAERLGVSIGTGLVSALVIRAMFPDRIKNQIKPGDWQLKLLR